MTAHNGTGLFYMNIPEKISTSKRSEFLQPQVILYIYISLQPDGVNIYISNLDFLIYLNRIHSFIKDIRHQVAKIQGCIKGIRQRVAKIQGFRK